MRISRDRLYELVSATPLSKLAPSLGVSATILASVCRQHNVPYPGSAFWTRKSLGQEVSLIELPSQADSDLESIEIEPQVKRMPRIIDADAHGEPRKESSNEGGASSIEASTTKYRTHSIISGWIADRERRQKEPSKSRDAWQIRMAPDPWSDIELRRHRILNELFGRLEARGAKITQAEKGFLRVEIDGEKIEFQIREKSRQVRKPADGSRYSYPTVELVGIGKLVFAIRTYLRGPHNEEWRETDQKPLEQQIPAIVERLFEGARILKAWHLELEEQRKSREQEAARRAERIRLIKQNEARMLRLGQIAENWKSADQIRSFISVVRSKPYDPEKEVHGKSLAQWLEWAEAAADELDHASTEPEALFALIGEVSGNSY